VIALDEEGGDVTRLDDTTGSVSPGAAALGYLDDPAVTHAAAATLAARLADAGVTVNLAPVADVNVEPRNPVIGVRSFGSDPELVARHVAAFVRGTQHAGVAACAKHFPGHGTTTIDSHHEVPTLARSAHELRSTEFVPFRAAIDAGVRTVMTGHLVAPALDPGAVATVSRRITTDVLRGALGFTGTVMTDALEMQAVAGPIGLVDGFVRAVAAGADAVESGALDYPELVDAVPSAVASAVADGRLSVERIADAARRTAELATPATPGAPVEFDPGSVAEGCIEVVGALPPLRAPVVVECRPPGGMASGELPWSLGRPLAELVAGTECVAVASAEDVAAVRVPPDRSIVLVVRDPHRHDWQADAIGRFTGPTTTVVVDVGWPAQTPADVPTIRTRGVAPALLAAAARVLAGRTS
jgi:beta-N-acetylhexosaminidase